MREKKKYFRKKDVDEEGEEVEEEPDHIDDGEGGCNDYMLPCFGGGHHMNHASY